MEVLYFGFDEVDDIVVDWEVLIFVGEFLGVCWCRSFFCLVKGKKVISNI